MSVGPTRRFSADYFQARERFRSASPFRRFQGSTDFVAENMRLRHQLSCFIQRGSLAALAQTVQPIGEPNLAEIGSTELAALGDCCLAVGVCPATYGAMDRYGGS